MNQFFVKYVKRVKNFPQITFVTPAKGNSRAKGNIKTSLNLVMLLPYHSFKFCKMKVNNHNRVNLSKDESLALIR